MRQRGIRAGCATLVALALLAAGGEPGAHACASCGCGDPTLTGIGLEKPFAGRLRGSLELRHRTDRLGEPRVDQLRLGEQRLDVQVSYSPLDKLTLLLTLPALQRSVQHVNLAQTTSRGIGDVELRGRVILMQDRTFSPRHLLFATAGLKAPTAPAQEASDGMRLPIELQPGTGSWDPLAGLSYGHFAAPWSVYTSVQGALATGGHDGYRASRSLRVTALLQRQLGASFGVRAGLDGRIDGKAIEAGVTAGDSGGSVWFASADLLANPMMDLLVFASIKVPVLQRLDGFHREGPMLAVGVAYDY